MTLTTEVRIHWPVPAVALLDHVTRIAGGDPATVKRRMGGTFTWDPPGLQRVSNVPDQGLGTLASVRWEDETAGTYHPGTTDVALLNEPGERETWTP